MIHRCTTDTDPFLDNTMFPTVQQSKNEEHMMSQFLLQNHMWPQKFKRGLIYISKGHVLLGHGPPPEKLNLHIVIMVWGYKVNYDTSASGSRSFLRLRSQCLCCRAKACTHIHTERHTLTSNLTLGSESVMLHNTTSPWWPVRLGHVWIFPYFYDSSVIKSTNRM